jgi:integrase
MPFLIEAQELKNGLIIFQRSDVDHKNWYCRVRIPDTKRYKTVSLKTARVDEAREMAFEHDADIRFRIKHQVPIFEKTFAEVALEYSAHLKKTAQSGQITMDRWQIVDGHIRRHLIPFIGGIPLDRVGEDQWTEYPFWRRQNNAPTKRTYGQRRKKAKNSGSVESGAQLKAHTPAKDGTIRQEMTTFRAIMNFSADKGYIRERQVPKGKMPVDKGRREEFTASEYKQLHTFARQWIKEGLREDHVWYRTMTYNYMLIMANTGMRTMEARNLRWRDISSRVDRQGRPFVAFNVRGKGKFRELVAANNVEDYLNRIRAISKATGPDDHVFTTIDGEQSKTLYGLLIGDLLTKSGLLYSASGSRRSAYCFRHTYATFRLMLGTDVYFLAKQMGTSVQMIEKHYGHITPTKNAERILQGIPGWEPMAEISDEKPSA